MTSRDFVTRAMEHIKELGKDMSNEDYSNSLEQLAYELETERQEVNWQLLTSENKFV